MGGATFGRGANLTSRSLALASAAFRAAFFDSYPIGFLAGLGFRGFRLFPGLNRFPVLFLALSLKFFSLSLANVFYIILSDVGAFGSTCNDRFQIFWSSGLSMSASCYTRSAVRRFE